MASRAATDAGVVAGVVAPSLGGALPPDGDDGTTDDGDTPSQPAGHAHAGEGSVSSVGPDPQNQRKRRRLAGPSSSSSSSSNDNGNGSDVQGGMHGTPLLTLSASSGKASGGTSTGDTGTFEHIASDLRLKIAQVDDYKLAHSMRAALDRLENVHNAHAPPHRRGPLFNGPQDSETRGANGKAGGKTSGKAGNKASGKASGTAQASNDGGAPAVLSGEDAGMAEKLAILRSTAAGRDLLSALAQFEVPEEQVFTYYPVEAESVLADIHDKQFALKLQQREERNAVQHIEKDTTVLSHWSHTHTPVNTDAPTRPHTCKAATAVCAWSTHQLVDLDVVCVSVRLFFSDTPTSFKSTKWCHGQPSNHMLRLGEAERSGLPRVR